ncbi:MAG: nitroreductase [Thermoplasmatales archaeon]|nr:nitroreductase [Thermoplasmatales archaeon]
MKFQELILKRQSCRSFNPTRKVPEKTLKKILEAGRMAPSAVGGQPYRLWAATGETAEKVSKARIGEMNKFIEDADCFIAITGHAYNVPAERAEKTEGMGFRGIDIGLLAAHIICAAEQLGVASCMIGLFDEPVAREIIGCDERIELLIALGYPTDGYEVREKRRMAFDDLITIL